MGNPQELRGLIDGRRISEHEGQQLAVNLIIEAVDRVITVDDSASRGLVILDIGGDGIVQHGASELAHAWNIDEWLEGSLVSGLDRDLRDPGGMVRHALEVGNNVDSGG